MVGGATRAWFVVCAAGVAALGACSGGAAKPAPTAVRVEAGSCPTTPEPLEGKIVGAAALEAAHRRVFVEVLLRATSLPEIPACPDGNEPERTCAERDAALAERRFLNGHQVDCVLTALGPVQTNFMPSWYERPSHTTLGETVPVALGLMGTLTWPEIQRVAAHPFVERVAAGPGSVPQVGGPAPAASAECPGAAADDAAAAVDKVASALLAPGRHPAVITLETDAILPENAACASLNRCVEAVPVAWERTILNTRDATCVRRRLDAEVKGYAGDVSYAPINGDNSGLPPLPPLGQTAFLVESFGFGLTSDEALRVAKHPYVRAISLMPGIDFDPPPEPGCPLDTSAPIPVRDCPTERDDGAGKVNPANVASLQDGAPHAVIVTVSGGGVNACPVEACVAKPCPALDDVDGYKRSVSLAAQRCVRDLIAFVRGSTTDDVFTFTEASALVATLTWAQIEVVKTHPHVLSIEASDSGTPPP